MHIQTRVKRPALERNPGYLRELVERDVKPRSSLGNARWLRRR